MALDTQTYRRIVLRQEVRIMETGKFAGVTAPGSILRESAAGVFTKHDVNGGDVAPLKVAEIDFLQGRGITTNYAANALGPVVTLRPGDKFVAILKDGENIAFGDYLQSAGDGTVRKAVAQKETNADSSGAHVTFHTRRLLAKALEARNLTDSSGADDSKWIKCEAV